MSVVHGNEWTPSLLVRCSSTDAVTANELLCLSFGQECSFRAYYIQGLTFLNSSITQNGKIQELIKYLNQLVCNTVSDHTVGV